MVEGEGDNSSGSSGGGSGGGLPSYQGGEGGEDSGGVLSRRQALEQFYQKFNPEKIGEIDTLLTNYKIKDITASLRARYGAVPSGWEQEDTTSWFA